MRESPQTLAVVNTKKDALALLEALEDESALHLSTLLCGRHRQRVIQDIRSRLDQGQVCRVVSTQVVEAGVDLDFPMVMRAVGPFGQHHPGGRTMQPVRPAGLGPGRGVPAGERLHTAGAITGSPQARR